MCTYPTSVTISQDMADRIDECVDAIRTTLPSHLRDLEISRAQAARMLLEEGLKVLNRRVRRQAKAAQGAVSEP